MLICTEHKFYRTHKNCSTDMKLELKISILTFRGSKQAIWGLKHKFLNIYEIRTPKSVYSKNLKSLR